MTGLEFLAALIDSLVWPATVVTLLVLFREAIKRLIPDLRALRYRDFELEFARRLESAEDKLETPVEVPELAEQGVEAGGEEAGPADADAEPSTVQQGAEITAPTPSMVLNRLAAISPRAAVAEAWLLVEGVLQDLAEKHGLSARQPAHGLIRSLASLGVLPGSTASSLDDLRSLRNDAVHRSEFELGSSGALDYVNLAVRVRHQLSVMLHDNQVQPESGG